MLKNCTKMKKCEETTQIKQELDYENHDGHNYMEECDTHVQMVDIMDTKTPIINKVEQPGLCKDEEIDRFIKGKDNKKNRPPVQVIDLHVDRPQKCALKIRVPVKEHPRYNFVGKLLGPKGKTLKALQHQTGCKIAVKGRGSMRDKDKEEELRKEGGKYAHLNEELHVLVQCYAEIGDGYNRLALALAELKKFVIPGLTEDMYGGGDGEEMGMNGAGAPRGRGGYRGGPPDRGRRGGFRGHGNGPAPGRRGGPRGGPRGAPSPHGPARGTAPRGARATPAASYDAYSSQPQRNSQTQFPFMDDKRKLEKDCKPPINSQTQFPFMDEKIKLEQDCKTSRHVETTPASNGEKIKLELGYENDDGHNYMEDCDTHVQMVDIMDTKTPIIKKVEQPTWLM